MKSILRAAALAGFAALCLGAAAPDARAGGALVGDTEGFGVTVVDGGRWDHGPRGRDGWERDHDRRWRRDGDRQWDHRGDRRAEWRRDRASCSPARALRAAERLGLRRVWLRGVSRGTIAVSGRRYGDRLTVVFARAPNCPVVGF